MPVKQGSTRGGYTMHKISCLACMNLVMCGKNIQNKVHVRCVLNMLENGRLVTLDDIIFKNVDGTRACTLFDNGRVAKDISWLRYIEELKKNFCMQQRAAI